MMHAFVHAGKPPYFDLPQMPALFRIVQDEHPPLPEGISKALEDFLLQCFQKVRARVCADKLVFERVGVLDFTCVLYSI